MLGNMSIYARIQVYLCQDVCLAILGYRLPMPGCGSIYAKIQVYLCKYMGLFMITCAYLCQDAGPSMRTCFYLIRMQFNLSYHIVLPMPGYGSIYYNMVVYQCQDLGLSMPVYMSIEFMLVYWSVYARMVVYLYQYMGLQSICLYMGPCVPVWLYIQSSTVLYVDLHTVRIPG